MQKDTFQASAFFFPHTQAGVLRITGETWLDFLQRQTTNDIHQLSPGKVILAVLTTPMARILDVFSLFLNEISGQQEVFALSLPGRVVATTAYLKRRIFFMDHVAVEDISDSFRQLDLFDRGAGQVLNALGLPEHLDQGVLLSTDVSGALVHIFRHAPGTGMGFRLVIPAASYPTLTQAIITAGANQLRRDEYEIKRIEAGIAASESELTEEYTPFEVNLQTAVSGSKGCYTGQEILSRQVTYDKITRHLTGLRLSDPVPSGSEVIAGGKPAGTVTSSAISPRFGPIALAVLRRPYHEPDSRLTIKTTTEEIEATTVPLPFDRSL